MNHEVKIHRHKCHIVSTESYTQKGLFSGLLFRK